MSAPSQGGTDGGAGLVGELPPSIASEEDDEARSAIFWIGAISEGRVQRNFCRDERGSGDSAVLPLALGQSLPDQDRAGVEYDDFPLPSSRPESAVAEAQNEPRVANLVIRKLKRAESQLETQRKCPCIRLALFEMRRAVLLETQKQQMQGHLPLRDNVAVENEGVGAKLELEADDFVDPMIASNVFRNLQDLAAAERVVGEGSPWSMSTSARLKCPCRASNTRGMSKTDRC